MNSLHDRASFFLIAGTIMLLVAAGCKKSSSVGGTTLSATIGAGAWVANYPVSGLYTSQSGQFDIAGLQVKSGDSTLFGITFSSPVVVNHAISSDTSQIDVGYIDDKSGTEYDGGSVAGHSIITVTSYDSANHKIGGTFTGVLYNVANGNDSLVVTGGTFNTTFITK